jgi:5'(3')-deoxyribonucleotidase
MFFEAPRFPDVFYKCLQLVREMRDDLVGGELKEFINNWCAKCGKFYKANGETKSIEVKEQTSEVIKEAAKRFSILCRTKWDEWLTVNGKEDILPEYHSEEEEETNDDTAGAGASSSGK